ncbi:MAG: hypothetical protein E6713_13725 [Sporomusaceae bacterium]|nr:hypothetical protein [Sporomusaceae bacterium]
MYSPENPLKVRLAKTLWFNTYRAQVATPEGEYLAALRLIPTIPLDRNEIPENAPEVKSSIVVLVEDALVTDEHLVEFEAALADELQQELVKVKFKPENCQFFYPSPPHMLAEESALPQ